MQNAACRLVGPNEHARLSGAADELLDRRVGVGRREEPPRYESGLRAHGSNQQFHRLLRHAVARALTTAPSLAGVSPAAADILIRHRWRRKGRQGRCRTNWSIGLQCARSFPPLLSATSFEPFVRRPQAKAVDRRSDAAPIGAAAIRPSRAGTEARPARDSRGDRRYRQGSRLGRRRSATGLMMSSPASTVPQMSASMRAG